MAHHLTEVQLKEQQRQTAEQEQAQQDRKQDVWTYHTQRELEADDPSLKDGLDPIKLKQWRRQIMKLLSTAGMNLKIPQWGIAAAALLCHRFFSRKSMKRNDRFVIATACLHLAAKMEESPKPIREVVKECLKVVHGRQSAKLKKATEPDELEKYKEETLVAERAVLYTLGFNLNINHPYRFLVSYLSELGLLHASTQATPYKHLMQNTWNFLNDSFRSTLCLQYSAEMICSGALYCANELNKRQHGPEGDLMIVVHKTHPNATFYSHFNITLEQAEDIAHQILTMYEDVKISTGSKPSTSAPHSAGNTPSLYSPASPSTVQGD